MFLKKKLIALKGSLFIVASTLIVACGSETPKEEVASSTEDSASVATTEAPKVTYSLPSPLQIASIFKKSGLKYKDGITSSKTDPAKYTTNFSKTINLGVYSADLSYTVLNKQTQSAMTYMKLSRQIADNLGMASIFDHDNLSKRFEKNLTNEDSLTYIIAELQMVTDIYLDENERQQITPIVFSGAWIESMYIGSKVFEKGKDKSLNNKLAEQMTILGSIINALKVEEKKDVEITGLIADLQGIKDIYDELPSVKNNPNAFEDSDKDLNLTDDEVSQLITKIEALRVKFING
jgi:hypothetical protein